MVTDLDQVNSVNIPQTVNLIDVTYNQTTVSEPEPVLQYPVSNGISHKTLHEVPPPDSVSEPDTNTTAYLIDDIIPSNLPPTISLPNPTVNLSTIQDSVVQKANNQQSSQLQQIQQQAAKSCPLGLSLLKKRRGRI